MKKIVLTNGCFDILHAGHVDCLQWAKAQGDFLVVAVNDDDACYVLKGPGRPINPLNHRMAVLSALRCVDKVEPFGRRLVETIYKIRPHVYVKGGDYSLEKLDPAERCALEDVRADIRFAPILVEQSTSKIIARARVKPI